ncbi:hypothetical protein PHLGIDRAFT_44551, partial [Phlebiopsis gigantea 11061_1 CR5-6]
SSFKIELPPELRRRGVHDVFHASLLRLHVPNDDRLFPGRLAYQVAALDPSGKEWAIDRIVRHSGTGADAQLLVRWSSGDET